MSIAAAPISADALYDIINIFEIQPWTKQLHEELAELWSLCSSRSQQLLLRDLIEKFCLFDAIHEEAACKAFNAQIQEWNLKPKETWIVAVANAEEIDGSTAGLQKLKNKVMPYEDWHSRFLSNIPSASKKIKNGQNIVLFDDFVGSGKKMLKKIAWIKKNLGDNGVTKFNLFCTCFSGMKFGLKHLSDESKVPVFSHIYLNRGISENYDDDKAKEALGLMTEIEEKLATTYKGKHMKDFSLGYEKSEALYCAVNENCPNNVFPVFWWRIKKDGKPFKTLLRRAG
ncbi:hypothetical protein GJ700_17770 [Duganella sp. FT92W]|uniref:PRTase-CE domain-containing protein n=1 Tax=Pseudoduganella rivuli TaxID=2666085 RepID=A0A7X2IPB6_9BURK|nr:hypothetical protein [Pseudoduganella rivuli]MRV73564.1 hypothetical protein [Pseudoduganella rivuli]